MRYPCRVLYRGTSLIRNGVRYMVSDSGDVLSELILVEGGDAVAFVSPLVARADEGQVRLGWGFGFRVHNSGFGGLSVSGAGL